MFSAKNIILTGFMGCGKTTVGRALAEELGRCFIDTDQLIVQRKGLSVAEIFARHGEDFFRVIERQLAAELAQEKELVIATGGKMMLDLANADLLRKSGIILCLTASAEEILQRVATEGKPQRPLLGESPSLEKIEQLLQQRYGGYAAFPQIATDRKRPEEIVCRIVEMVKSIEKRQQS